MKSTIIYDSTRDCNGQFKAGYRASIGMKNVNIEYLTNWQGDRDKIWKVPIREFDALQGTVQDKVMQITENYEPRWNGPKIK